MSKLFSTFIPGPIVAVNVILLTYSPLTVAGLTFRIVLINAFKFSNKSSSLNDTFPTTPWIIPNESVLYSTFPALTSSTINFISINQDTTVELIAEDNRQRISAYAPIIFV